MLPLMPHSVSAWLQVLTCVGTVLLVAAWIFGRRAHKPYPAMGPYLLVNALAGSLIFATLRNPIFASTAVSRNAGCLIWLVSYAISGVLVFFIARQIFRDVLSSLAGLRRLALVVFNWVALISVVVSIPAAIIPILTHTQPIQLVILQTLRGISIMEFSLLAFVLLAARSLSISRRNPLFGITLGFGILALVDTICFIALLRTGAHVQTWILIRRVGSTLTAALWLLWLLIPEPARGPATQRSAQLQRWNEIAVALGKPAPQIALTNPEPHGLFLQDVEAVVDRVLSRNDLQPPRLP